MREERWRKGGRGREGERGTGMREHEDGDDKGCERETRGYTGMGTNCQKQGVTLSINHLIQHGCSVRSSHM